jgi:SAM-dependent methyltransferase
VDFSQAALNLAKKNGAKKLVKAPAENLPFKDNEFEVSLSNGVLEHCYDQKKAISEMVRVSKFQIIIAHARLPWSLEYIRKPIVEGIFGLKDQPIEKPLTLSQIEKMLNENKSRVLVRGVWNYIDPRWIWKKIPYGLIKIPSHYFVISIKTKNLNRKFLKES